MGKTLFDINMPKIEQILIKSKKAYSLKELNLLLHQLKNEKLVAQDMRSMSFFQKLQEQLQLKTYSIQSENINKDRYSIQLLDKYSLISTFEKEMFFSMSTALNIQGFSDFRNDLIFYSKELTKKVTLSKNNLTQESIDNAFKRAYRYTKNTAKYKNNHLVYLTPKYTNHYEVIKYKEYNVSSINRAFVEMLINVQYFKSFTHIIDCYSPLKHRLNLEIIYQVVENFDLIYPYHQLIGFTLENIGFNKNELSKFKSKVSLFNFYTEKNKENYKFDSYWNIYYL